MRIIFFNIWHGKLWDELKEYLFKETRKTDIFCFTEVDPGLQTKLIELLPNYQPFYEELIRTNYLNGDIDGQSIFVKEGIKVKNLGKQYLYKITKDDCGALQTAEIVVKEKKILIGSIHGMAQPGDKLDNPQRIGQSKKAIDYYKNKRGFKIIGGDFNLYPNTRSVKMFEEAGYRDLIKDFHIKNTRNRLSWEQFMNVQYFADYVFVTPDINVRKFEVPNVEVSDHLPLILDFDL